MEVRTVVFKMAAVTPGEDGAVVFQMEAKPTIVARSPGESEVTGAFAEHQLVVPPDSPLAQLIVGDEAAVCFRGA